MMNSKTFVSEIRSLCICENIYHHVCFVVNGLTTSFGNKFFILTKIIDRVQVPPRLVIMVDKALSSALKWAMNDPYVKLRHVSEPSNFGVPYFFLLFFSFMMFLFAPLSVDLIAQ